jgi:hypothetical protein
VRARVDVYVCLCVRVFVCSCVCTFSVVACASLVSPPPPVFLLLALVAAATAVPPLSRDTCRFKAAWWMGGWADGRMGGWADGGWVCCCLEMEREGERGGGELVGGGANLLCCINYRCLLSYR